MVVNNINVVTLNEICEGDLNRLFNLTNHQFSAVAFAAVYVADNSAPETCTNGERYGVGIMVTQGFSNPSNSTGVYDYNKGWQPLQQPGEERRAFACARLDQFPQSGSGKFNVCTTHLATDESWAIKQCNHLLRERIPDFKASFPGNDLPTIVGGDLNMEYDPADAENVQLCVPNGYYRKGDGNVQHIIAPTEFAHISTQEYYMAHTDHNALAVTVSVPW
ncbi:hypothetical protein [Streptosporangium sp. KLBMP 9127]|nr:hypothetical protein [Streptosporangium sp. KLBMP 9127]